VSTIAPAPLSMRAQRGGERGRSRASQALFDGLGGEPTLDELIAGVWEGLAAHRPARCPVCEAEMRPVYGAHASQPDDSGTAPMSSRTIRARPEQARQDAERAASSSARDAGRVPGGGLCTGCGTTLQ
jgi:hypothetical protein